MFWNWCKTKGPEPATEPISEPKPVIIEVKSKKEIEKEQLIKHLLECPNDLFEPYYRYCRYLDEDDRTLLEVALERKMLTESDLCELGSQVNLDWFKISEIIPLSQKTLTAYSADVNWRVISYRFMHERNFEFILTFAKFIKWDSVQKVNLYDNQIEFLVFVENSIPLDFAVRKKMLTSSHIQVHMDRIIDEVFPEFCRSYKAEFIDSIPHSEKYELALCTHADAYVHRCITDSYVPRTYLKPIINRFGSIGSRDWCAFLIACQPDEAFVREHIVQAASGYVSNETWKVLSGKCINVLSEPWRMIRSNKYKVQLSSEFIEEFSEHLAWQYLMRDRKFDIETVRAHIRDEGCPEVISRYQCLTPDFIDEFAHILDWYYLCENHDLPEWLMEKHVNKLNWGQVSWYQKMSKEFIEKFKARLNESKLRLNSKLRS